MISSIKGEHSTIFSRLIVLTWLSTLITPVLLFVSPLQAPYIQIFSVTTFVFLSTGVVGLYKDMGYLQEEERIDWEPSKAYYLGIVPLPTSFFILGFYLGFRDKAYGIFDRPKETTDTNEENESDDE